MKPLFSLVLLLFVSTVFGQTHVFNWKKPKYSKAIAYLYGLTDEEGAGDILYAGRLNKTVVDTVGVSLSSAQVTKVISVATGNNNAEFDEPSECFMPHHGIVFYDEHNKPLASVTICFDCERMEFDPKIVTPEKGLTILKDVILELGFPVFKNYEGYVEYSKKIKK